MRACAITSDRVTPTDWPPPVRVAAEEIALDWTLLVDEMDGRDEDEAPKRASAGTVAVITEPAASRQYQYTNFVH